MPESSTAHDVRNEPLAIVGVGCRFPGGAGSPQRFWQLLCAGVDAIREVPRERWDLRKFYDADPDRPAKSVAREGGFLLEDLRLFDAAFFGISAREAEQMDPQQRLLLEATWEAIEDGGLVADALRFGKTGVFIGGFCLDTKMLRFSPLNRELLSGATVTGSPMTMLANKISYVFDLKGPSVSMDTACSSSLLALHFAVRSLRGGDCDVAIVGGVNAMLVPEYPISMSRGRFLSDHSRCKAFDADARGYTRSEGCGVVILKPLHNAVAAGDNIRAVVVETGTNQDGRTTGISLPNAEAQKSLIREVYARAGIPTSAVQYVEAHGTGTQAGDYAEAHALHETFAVGREPENRLLVGSVKTNLGHLEAAAGIAGLIKAILCLEHKAIPPNIHFQKPNPKIPFDRMCLRVPTHNETWPAYGGAAYAGINSFGYGGANAHVLLREAPPQSAHEGAGESPRLVPVSARSRSALAQRARDLAELLRNDRTATVWDLAYTLSQRRDHHAHRAALVYEDREMLITSLDSLADGQADKRVTVGQVLAPERSRLSFVYTGMGPQWWGMGQELMAAEPIFRTAIERFDAQFGALAGWSLLKALGSSADNSRVTRTEVAQPANAALQMALTETLAHYGVAPDAVVGHSVGEIPAAWAAGALSFEDAVLVSYHRSRLQQKMTGRGGMLAVGLSEEEARGLVSDYPCVAIAAVNSASSVTLVGPGEDLEQVAALLAEYEIFQRRLKVEVPYHSAVMEEVKDELLSSLAHLVPTAEKLPLYSTVTGDRMMGHEFDAAYVWSNVRQPVAFAAAFGSMLRDGVGVFMEVGPHPVLRASMRECLKGYDGDAQLVGTLMRDEPERRSLLNGVATLHTLGRTVSWQRLAAPSGRLVPLPAYPWQREHLWAETERSREERCGRDGHVFLNEDLRLSYPAWEVELNRYYFPFIEDHKVQGNVVVPGATYVEAGLALNRELNHDKPCTLSDLVFHQMLVPDRTKLQRLHCAFHPERKRFVVQSRLHDDRPDWRLHATGTLLPLTCSQREQRVEREAIERRCSTVIDGPAFYERLARCGLEYGPQFAGVQSVRVGRQEALAMIRVHDAVRAGNEPYQFHPTALDACFQTFVAVVDDHRASAEPYVPVEIERLHWLAPLPTEFYCHARVSSRDDRCIVGDLTVFDASGKVSALIEGLQCRALGADRRERGRQSLQYGVVWEEEPLDAVEPVASDEHTWLVFSTPGGASEKVLADVLASHPRCVRVTPIDASAAVAENGTHGVRRGSREDLLALLAAEPHVSHIVYGWSLDGDDASAMDVDAFATQCEELGVLAACAPHGAEKLVLTALTRGSQAVRAGEPIQSVSASVLGGLAQVASNEREDVSFRVVDLPPVPAVEEARWVAQEVLAARPDTDIAYRDGRRFVYRLRPLGDDEERARELVDCPTSDPVSLVQRRIGDVDSLGWVRSSRANLADNELEIEVRATPLNFKDVLKVYNTIASRTLEGTFIGYALGMECSGRVCRVGTKVTKFAVGDEVFTGIRSRGGFHSYVSFPEDSVVLKKSPRMTFEEAVLFVPFFTAYYGMITMARLQPGERVLIHNAAGGVGLAAVQVANWRGAEVFATAGTDEKRDYLRGIGVAHVFDSRSLGFVEDVRKATQGRGIDVTLSAVAGDALVQSFELLASYGRHVEIGKRDIADNVGLPMRTFQRNTSFIGVDVDRMLLERPGLLLEIWSGEIAPLFESGDLRPLPQRVFPAANVKDAFRAMQEGRHIGRMVVSFADQTVPVQPAAREHLRFEREMSVLVTGGTRGVGFEIAEWLTTKNIRHLVLASRSGEVPEDLRPRVNALRERGVEVHLAAVDVANEAAVVGLLAKIEREMPPLGGIVHGAMVLDDARLADLTRERFATVFSPKARGAWLLHQHTKHKSLDFFVCLSSISALIGNKGQANYVAANAFLDGLAHLRRGMGLPSLTINLGAVADVGVVARDHKLEELFRASGIATLSPRQVLDGLEAVWQHPAPQVGLFGVDWGRWTSVNRRDAASSRLRHVIASADRGADAAIPQAVRDLAVLPDDERQAAMTDMVCELLAKVLKSPTSQVDKGTSIKDLGVDSLMVVELQVQMENKLGVEVSDVELLRGPTAIDLGRLLLKRISPSVDSGASARN